MKIFSAAQIRAWDQYTIQNEPIPSIDLMERASRAFVGRFLAKYRGLAGRVCIFCGPGNNGGDGLAIGRLLRQAGVPVHIYLCRIGSSLSTDCQTNLQRLQAAPGIQLSNLNQDDAFPELRSTDLLIDAIFGSGLNRPVSGYWAALIQYINHCKLQSVIAVDIPSGLFPDQSSAGNTIIEADHTISFQVPKLGFLMPENYRYVREWEVADIGLHGAFAREEPTRYHLVGGATLRSKLRVRDKFDHKGTYGHTLLIAGSYGKMGAALLAARACLRSGVGLLTVHLPACGYSVLQSQVPEAMVQVDSNAHYWSEQITNLESYKAIAVGCGIDQRASTKAAFFSLLQDASVPLVLDADALNILSQHPEQMVHIPAGSILTPHPKEFERLFGKSADHFQRLAILRKQARTMHCIILLKGAYTAIALPNGQLYFNQTGNPGMATGGSGDALTGVLAGLLSQGYTATDAALLGVYLHGLAGDIAAGKYGQAALLPTDLIDHLGAALIQLKEKEYEKN